MRHFNLNNSGLVVKINILHQRPNYPKDIKFMNTYKVKHDPKLDMKTIFYEAFTQAHPDWSILEIIMQKKE